MTDKGLGPYTETPEATALMRQLERDVDRPRPSHLQLMLRTYLQLERIKLETVAEAIGAGKSLVSKFCNGQQNLNAVHTIALIYWMMRERP